MNTMVKFFIGAFIYFSFTLAVLFIAGGYGSFWFSFVTIICCVVSWMICNKLGETGCRKVLGIDYINNKFNIDLLSEE